MSRPVPVPKPDLMLRKFLNKMDRNAIMREIRQIKSKLSFDPKEHKCENLSVLTIEGDNWRDIPGLMPARYRRNRKNKPQAETPQPKCRPEFQILKNAQKELKENQKEEPCIDYDKFVNNSKGKENIQFSSTPNPKESRSYMMTRMKTLGEKDKNSSLSSSPEVKKTQKVFGTPATCASSNFGSAEKSISDANFSTANDVIKKPNSCFRNLTGFMTKVDCKSKNEVKQEPSTMLQTADEEIYFDFDFEPILTVNKLDVEFENLISLNSLNTECNERFDSESSFDNFFPMGDHEMPLSTLY